MTLSIMAENPLTPVSNSNVPLLTMTLALVITGIIVIVFGVIEFFMDHYMFSMTKENSLIAMVVIGIVPILISPFVWKKTKIGFILAVAYSVFLIGFGFALTGTSMGENKTTTMFFRFFYALLGIFDIIDIMTSKVRKLFF